MSTQSSSSTDSYLHWSDLQKALAYELHFVSKRIENGQVKYFCRKCPKGFPTVERLNKHVGSAHEGLHLYPKMPGGKRISDLHEVPKWEGLWRKLVRQPQSPDASLKATPIKVHRPRKRLRTEPPETLGSLSRESLSHLHNKVDKLAKLVEDLHNKLDKLAEEMRLLNNKYLRPSHNVHTSNCPSHSSDGQPSQDGNARASHSRDGGQPSHDGNVHASHSSDGLHTTYCDGGAITTKPSIEGMDAAKAAIQGMDQGRNVDAAEASLQGTGYKSTKELNDDLCGGCFRTIRNENDYEKLDRPFYHHPHGHYRPPCFERGPRHLWLVKPSRPIAGHQASGSSTSDEHKKLDAWFVKDVTQLSPGTKFTKIWRISNIGTIPWPQSTQLVHIGGDVLCAKETVALELPEGGLPCGEEVEVSVDLTAPAEVGQYVSHWRLTAPFGQKFGYRVWVVIHVVPHREHSPQFQASLQNGKSSVEVNKESMDVDLDGANSVTMDVDVNGANVVVLDVMVDGETALIEPLSVEESCHKEHENADPFIVCPDPSSHSLKDVGMSTEVGVNSLVVYPDPTSHDLQDVGMCTEEPSEGGSNRKYEEDRFPLVEKPTESTDWFEVVENEGFYTPEGSKEGEELGQESLLQALESVGFADRNVNISTFKSHNFVLQNAVDDLLAATRWEGALKDLEEMGFHGKDANIRLLVKNKGSLKQTVRDLVKGLVG